MHAYAHGYSLLVNGGRRTTKVWKSAAICRGLHTINNYATHWGFCKANGAAKKRLDSSAVWSSCFVHCNNMNTMLNAHSLLSRCGQPRVWLLGVGDDGRLLFPFS